MLQAPDYLASSGCPVSAFEQQCPLFVLVRRTDDGQDQLPGWAKGLQRPEHGTGMHDEVAANVRASPTARGDRQRR